jgi:hypothetical protein
MFVPISRFRNCLTILVASGLVACSRDILDPEVPRVEDGVQRVQLVAAAVLQNAESLANEAWGDGMFLKIEAAAPGFAGFYWDDVKGAFVMQLAKGADPEGARVAVREIAADGRTDFGDGRELNKAVDASVLYAFSELVAAKRLLGRTVFVRGGALAIDADERANRVRIDIASGSDRDKIESAIRASGVPREMVILATETPILSTASIRDASRPTIVGGMQIGFWLGSSPARCTLGYNVTTSLGETGFLTAGHCASNPYGFGATGMPIYQNSAGSSAAVGSTFLNPAWNLTSPPSCVNFSLCTMADVGFVQYASPSYLEKRVVQTKAVGTNYAGGSITVKAWWTASGGLPPTYVGQSVDKVGRTTGWTRGSIDATCVDQGVNVTSTGVQLAGAYMVLCSDRVVNARVGTGDSGAPVWVTNGGVGSALQPLGILFGGGPMDLYDSGDGSRVCSGTIANDPCKYTFSNWFQLSNHLNRYFNPSP